MKNKITVSVIMTAYNTWHDYLREAIDSILSQTFTDFELLIMDDGSTNDVAAVIQEYTDTRIKYFYQKHAGISVARNQLLKQARGKYIAIMDSDDVSLPERLEKQVKYLDENPNVGLLGGNGIIIPANRPMKYPRNVSFVKLLHGCFLIHSSVMWRRDLFEFNKLEYNTDFAYAEDYELWSRAVRYCHVQNLPDVIIKYRKHTANVSVTKQRAMNFFDARVKQSMMDFLTHDSDLQEQLTKCIYPFRRVRTWIYLFGVIPIIRIVYLRRITQYFLFGIIPLWTQRDIQPTPFDNAPQNL